MKIAGGGPDGIPLQASCPDVHHTPAHLHHCSIWLRGDGRQMTAVFFAVRLVSTTERGQRKVFGQTPKTLLASLLSSLTSDTPETIMASDYADYFSVDKTQTKNSTPHYKKS